ncbi:TraQ, partial [Escherichia coli]|nr:TraQ [Escherichia coli]
MDMVQMLANAVNELAGLGVRLVLTIASVGGIAMVILYLS